MLTVCAQRLRRKGHTVLFSNDKQKKQWLWHLTLCSIVSLLHTANVKEQGNTSFCHRVTTKLYIYSLYLVLYPCAFFNMLSTKLQNLQMDQMQIHTNVWPLKSQEKTQECCKWLTSPLERLLRELKSINMFTTITRQCFQRGSGGIRPTPKKLIIKAIYST